MVLLRGTQEKQMNKISLSRCAELESCGLFRVLEVTRSLSTPIELNEILRLVVEAALRVLDAERGTVFLFDAEKNELFSRVATGSKEIRFLASTGIAGETVQKRRLINVEDCYSDLRFNQEIDRKTGFRSRCLLSIPLIGLEEELVGVLQVLNKRDGVFTVDDEALGRILAAQCGVAIQRAKLIEDHVIKLKLESDLALARDIQMGVLPAELPSIEGYQLACWTKPADETGGDVYDAVALEGQRVALLLGDATGHGVGPALSVTQMRSMVRLGLRMGREVDALMAQIDYQLKEDLADNRFITAFLGVLDPTLHQLEYQSCGQGPLIHFSPSSDKVEFLEASALPLGVMPGISVGELQQQQLQSGDIFAVISDGFFEYESPAEEEFGKERVGRIIRDFKGEDLSDLVEELVGAVNEFSGGRPQDDDMTAVMLRRG
jgi:phosphoserine phosphatase